MMKKTYTKPTTSLVQVCQCQPLLLISGTGDARLDVTDIIGYDGVGSSFGSDEEVAAPLFGLMDD